MAILITYKNACLIKLNFQNLASSSYLPAKKKKRLVKKNNNCRHFLKNDKNEKFRFKKLDNNFLSALLSFFFCKKIAKNKTHHCFFCEKTVFS